MRKDYMLVDEDSPHADEASFVEGFWSRVWEEQNVGEVAKSRIDRREEFRIMDPYLSRLPPNSRLLDGGCGLGEWTVYYVSRGFDVVGLDISRSTIDRLRRQFPGHRFMAGDIRQTPFEPASFDAYFSWGTFEHFEDGLGRCFDEARRILKPGGYAFITVPFHNARHVLRDRRALWRWDEHFDKREGYRSPMRFYQWRLTVGELQREFELHGFTSLRVTPIHKDAGLRRSMKHDLGLLPGTLAHRVMRRLLSPVVPGRFVAHMIMGVAQKRQ